MKPKEAKELFEAHAEKSAGDSEMGFTDGKAVNIDGFLQTLQSRYNDGDVLMTITSFI